MGIIGIPQHDPRPGCHMDICGQDPPAVPAEEWQARAIRAEEELALQTARANLTERRRRDLVRIRDEYRADLEHYRRSADMWNAEYQRLRQMLSELGFCYKDGDALPCMTCGAGL